MLVMSVSGIRWQNERNCFFDDAKGKSGHACWTYTMASLANTTNCIRCFGSACLGMCHSFVVHMIAVQSYLNMKQSSRMLGSQGWQTYSRSFDRLASLVFVRELQLRVEKWSLPCYYQRPQARMSKAVRLMAGRKDQATKPAIPSQSRELLSDSVAKL